MTTAIQVLYKQGGGSEEIQLVKQLQPAQFEVILRRTIRYLEKKFEAAAMEMLENLPFELWHATNDFGDSFDVLFLKVDRETYVDIEELTGPPIWRSRVTDGCPAIANAFDRVSSPVRFIAVGYDLDEDVVDVAPPSLSITSSIVDQALRQAETLIGAHGAASAMDRLHTAFHGYLRFVCKAAQIEANSKIDDAGITSLFSLLREKHPKLAIADAEEKERINKIFRGLSKVLDAIDSIRNHNTLVHPNPQLGDPEAMLAINAIRTMLRYLDSRLR
jgi:hypothetical protein